MSERHHFLIDPQRITRDTFFLNGSEGHHLRNVVRLGEMDEIYLLDRKGKAYRSIIENVESTEITGRVVEVIQDYNSPSVKLHLAIGLLKGSKIDEVAKRTTELGVTSITPLLMQHSVKKSLNRERIMRVIESAQKQSGRGRAPDINDTVDFDEWCSAVPHQYSAYADQSPEAVPLNRWLESTSETEDLWLLIGPEGGFHEDEISSMKEYEIPAVSLGQARLRSETAAIAASAVILEFHHARRSDV
ncbi:MAG: RsmE family RNA methyltransferase [Candidatus Marinimicrobia bacterium]|jgi:16S rRNA (uracil1498-N3)-methyltransferase|nr:RsmE family RNA methyltransferase [Candidatus Neomarinimicrobiota bacterium]MDP6569371.1 RsmE family RNA methyltransferase [Candidatus Neomarinimicrobiota bacterium]MDP7025806.1 RsmE family RNA methyltransferase [Candidatus Neomarinimicrobiota bacterium]|tara:strand:+ start:871 stop:1608 length:738 start_codon:yes stop_codon:yes gene_type:complete